MQVDSLLPIELDACFDAVPDFKSSVMAVEEDTLTTEKTVRNIVKLIKGSLETLSGTLDAFPPQIR
jgi:cell division GTPase FtsZ